MTVQSIVNKQPAETVQQQFLVAFTAKTRGNKRIHGNVGRMPGRNIKVAIVLWQERTAPAAPGNLAAGPACVRGESILP